MSAEEAAIRLSFSSDCIFLLIAVLIGAAVIVVSLPRFIGAAINLIGDQAVTLAVNGRPLNNFSYERAVRSREHATTLYTSRSAFAQLGYLHYNQFILAERGALEQLARGPDYRESAIEAFEDSLIVSAVQPTAWLVLAEFFVRDDKYANASEALDWSLRTGYFHRSLVEWRVEIAFALWGQLTPLTRERLQPTLVELARRQPDALAQLAVDAGMAEDTISLLGRQEPDGALLAARFYRAAGDYVGFATPLTAQLGDHAVMQRLIASAGLMITIALPVPGFTMSIDEYLAIKKGEVADWSESDVLRYLTGMLDATLTTGEVARMQGNPIFCMSEEQMMALQPGEVKVTLDLMLDQFEQEMPNFRELAQTRTIGIATLQLLTYLYACEDPSLAN